MWKGDDDYYLDIETWDGYDYEVRAVTPWNETAYPLRGAGVSVPVWDRRKKRPYIAVVQADRNYYGSSSDIMVVGI